MFSPFPQFEKLAFHLNINWGGRQRPIIARLEQWPQSRYAILVCHFQDEPEYGEWVVMPMTRVPHFIGNPGKLLGNRAVWDIVTRRLTVTFAWKEARLERLVSIIKRAFKNDNFQIGRILHLTNWPDEPRILLWCPLGASWSKEWSMQSTVPFEWLPAPLHLSDQQMLDMIDARWNEPESDMRFAWCWANLSETERLERITGYTGNFSELEEVMKWIMLCTSCLWEVGTGWTWELRSPDGQEEETDSYWMWSHSDYFFEQDEDLMGEWSQFLFSIFVPRWRGDWFDKYRCVRDFWGYRSLGEVVVNVPPTMHERLEARFALREWLADRADTDTIELSMGASH